MTTSPGVHDRSFRIISHSCGAEQVPPGVSQQPGAADYFGSGGGHHLLCARESVRQHFCRVVTEPVVDLRSRNAVGIDEVGVERDRVAFFGQVFAQNPNRRGVIKSRLERFVMPGSPGDRSRPISLQRSNQRTGAA